MAMSVFEGFEKRLELHFSGDDPLGLRRLDINALEQILHAVQCSIVSALANRHFDSYVLSESSLFVYPYKIIIKTCGTTQLLKSIPHLLAHASYIGLRLRCCRYTRGCFIFPKAQTFPHTSFAEEVLFLKESLPGGLCYRKARIFPSMTSHSWHVYTASDSSAAVGGALTVEVCMTELDRVLAQQFYWQKEDFGATCSETAKKMTASSGIAAINRRALICDFAFEPCGYSMNGLDQDRYSTIHVTPEDGFSYASFECVANSAVEIATMLRKTVRVFRPGVMSVSICTSDEIDDDGNAWSATAEALKSVGMSCRGGTAEEFSGSGTVSFQVFTAARRK